MSTYVSVECLDCSHRFDFYPATYACPRCGSQWMEARYDLKRAGENMLQWLPARSYDLWRFRDLLPVQKPNPVLIMGEGGTPLIRAANLGMMLGCPNIFIKDERQGPTNSFKDRQASVGIAALKEAGINEMVLASTGNVAISYSAYAARAGIKLWAFLTSLVPAEKMREVAIYGTQVVKVTSSYDQAKQLAAEFARQRGLYLERGSRSIPSVEGMKTIAFEVAEQLTDVLGPPAPLPNHAAPPTRWRVPDWYIQAVSGGLGPQGVIKGFSELCEMGWTERIPAIASVQSEGCAPMVHAWQQGLEKAEPVHSPRTHIATLSTGDPGRTYTILRQRMMQGGGGVFESVTDEEAFRTIHIMAKMEGVSMEPAAAVAFAGLIKMVRAGAIKPTDVVVVNCTGHTMPIEKMVLGDNWSRDVYVPPPQALQEVPEEGLLAALSRVTAERFPRVAIVDDTPDARRLIRRILQSQGDYTLYEAPDGDEAIRLAKKEHPDLIILDLMMPEVDGFAVLDILKADSETASIPVIVVTAKELTPQEETRLRGRIHKLMQKGEFMNDELADEVRALLR
ncbi:MAG: pyridoxal-phosphate dependent enzyme [Chloroflexota bacterium]